MNPFETIETVADLITYLQEFDPTLQPIVSTNSNFSRDVFMKNFHIEKDIFIGDYNQYYLVMNIGY